jgi:hypothetical protein
MKKTSLIALVLTALALFLAACGGEPPQTNTLSVTVVGQGSVTSEPVGIARSTPGTATASFPEGASVTLTAVPPQGGTVTWSGDCTGTSTTCTVTMSSARTVTATFSGGNGGGDPTLTVNVSGQGTVTSSPAGISAPGTNTATFAPNTEVTLTATPATAGTAINWGGACSGASGSTCTVTMDASKTVSVTFGGGGGGGDFEAGQVFTNSSDLELNYDRGFGFHQFVGVRFVPTLPSGVTFENVTGAFIQFSAREGERSNLTVQIAAQADSNPPTFTTEAFNISSRPRTSSVSWAVPAWGTGFSPSVEGRSPDLRSLMTEAGWTSGNAVVFVISGDTNTTVMRNAWSFEGASENPSVRTPPTLVLTYGAGQTLEVPVTQGSDDAEEVVVGSF